MSEPDADVMRRSAKLTAALSSLEEYFKEVVANNGMKPKVTVDHVLQTLRRSMQASSKYHHEMARESEEAGNEPNGN